MPSAVDTALQQKAISSNVEKRKINKNINTVYLVYMLSTAVKT